MSKHKWYHKKVKLNFWSRRFYEVVKIRQNKSVRLNWKPLFTAYINSTGNKNRLERLLICKMHYQVKKSQWNMEIERTEEKLLVIFCCCCWIGRAQRGHKDFVVYFSQVSDPNGYKANSFSVYSLWNNDHNIKLMKCDRNVKALIKKSFTHLGYFIKRLINIGHGRNWLIYKKRPSDVMLVVLTIPSVLLQNSLAREHRSHRTWVIVLATVKSKHKRVRFKTRSRIVSGALYCV